MNQTAGNRPAVLCLFCGLLTPVPETRVADDPRISQDFERLVLRRQGNPVKMNRQATCEDGQVQIDPGERSQAERDSQKIQLFHKAKYMTELGFPNLDRPALLTL